MAYSEKTYTGDGTTTDFAVTFDYLDQSHVKVSVNKVLTTTVGSDYKFTWNNSTNIRVDTVIDGNPVPTGLEIRLIRGTPIATPAVVFGGAASLSSENLNKNSEYLTFALQEATDANEEFTKLYLGAFASAPTVDNEGEALQVGAVYYDSVLSALYYWTGATWIVGESTIAAEIFKTAAEAARDAAVVAKDAAVVAQGAAVVAQGAAEAAASTAATDASAAVAAAVATAEGHADDASVSATSASTSASNASTSASAAAASAASIDTAKLAGIEAGAQVNRALASQAEAEAGTDNIKGMTPLRVAEAVAALGGASEPDVQTLDVSGTWVKPTGFDPKTLVRIRMWGAGGGGARRDSANSIATGGNAGAAIEFYLRLEEMGATEAATIGAGGSGRSNDGDGSNGGSTTFMGITCQGGLGGDQQSNGTSPINPKTISSAPTIAGYIHTAEDGPLAGQSATSNSSDGVDGILAGGGGGSSNELGTNGASLGGTSKLGGKGGDGSVNGNGENGGVGAGGGASCNATSGAGGNGRVEVVVG